MFYLLSTYTALRLKQICGGLCQTRKTPDLIFCHFFKTKLNKTDMSLFSPYPRVI
jgi:hypothetical protein